MSTRIELVRRTGLLNVDAPDLAELTSDKFQRENMVAYCSSLRCAKRCGSSVIKHNQKYPNEECVDCGNYVKWKQCKRAFSKSYAV